MSEQDLSGRVPQRCGSFYDLFADLLRERQGLPKDRINLRTFCAEISEYDYSTLRKMITGTIRLQPRAIELMAQALEVPPETFLEYQVFQITECLGAHPEICPYVYRTVLTRARIMEELQAAGMRVRRQPIFEDERSVESNTNLTSPDG
jgi:hypothetical protein